MSLSIHDEYRITVSGRQVARADDFPDAIRVRHLHGAGAKIEHRQVVRSEWKHLDLAEQVLVPYEGSSS